MMRKSDGPESRAPRRSREDVVTAALVILDRQGLPDLTMRNLASSLGLQPSALYWHFPNKQTLLAAVADEIVSRTRPSSVPSEDWRAAARAEAAALHDALLAFRDGAELVSSTLALGLGGGDAVSRLAESIRPGGFGRVTVARAAEALLHFVVGQASHEQQRLQADSLGVLAEPLSAGVGALGEPAGGSAGAGVFELGVSLFLDGLTARAGAAATS